MPNDIFIFPDANPLAPVFQSDKLPSNSANDYMKVFNPSYNFKDFRADLFNRSIKPWEDDQGYVQPYQQSDYILLQWLGNDSTASNYTARLLDKNGSVFTGKSVTVVQDAGTYTAEVNGVLLTNCKLYTILITLYDVPEGYYFVQTRHGSGSFHLNVIFEPVHIKQIHRNTSRIDYRNTYNDQAMIYPSTSYLPQIRFHGFVEDPEPDAEFNVYEDQPKNTEMVSGIPFRVPKLQIGLSTTGIPKYMSDKINRISICDVMYINGKQYTREQGSKLEPKAVEGQPLSAYTLNLRERFNTSTVDIGYTRVVMGAMPQTNYFWVEQMTVLGGTSVIRKGFKGKRNFLDYLNTQFNLGLSIFGVQGYWSEDDMNQLVFQADDSYTISGTWSLAAYDVLLYGLRIVVNGAGTVNLTFYKGAIGSTVYYAIAPGNGSANVNKTAYTGTPNPSYTFTGKGEFFIYFSDCEQLEDTSSTAVWESFGGDLPPSFKDLRINHSATKLRAIDNNIFRFVNANGMTMIWLQNQSLGTYQVDDIVRMGYDSIGKLNVSCQVYLDAQSPSAPPSKSDPGIKFFISKIASKVSTFQTD